MVGEMVRGGNGKSEVEKEGAVKRLVGGGGGAPSRHAWARRKEKKKVDTLSGIRDDWDGRRRKFGVF